MVKKNLSNLYLILIFVFLYMPIILLIIFSFNDAKYGSDWTGFTLRWYEELFRDRSIVRAVKNTVTVALLSSAISTIIGTVAAVGIDSMKPKNKKIIYSMSYIPMINPDIVIGVSLLSLLSLFKFVKLGIGTLVLSHITFCLPYVVFAVLPKLQQLDPHLEEAAYDLGATPMEAFFKVIFPEIRPGIVSGFLLSITMSLDDFIVSFFTTGSGVSTLSIQVYSMTKRGVTPKLNALTTLMFIIILIMMMVNFARDRKK